MKLDTIQLRRRDSAHDAIHRLVQKDANAQYLRRQPEADPGHRFHADPPNAGREDEAKGIGPQLCRGESILQIGIATNLDPHRLYRDGRSLVQHRAQGGPGISLAHQRLANEKRIVAEPAQTQHLLA